MPQTGPHMFLVVKNGVPFRECVWSGPGRRRGGEKKENTPLGSVQQQGLGGQTRPAPTRDKSYLLFILI